MALKRDRIQRLPPGAEAAITAFDADSLKQLPDDKARLASLMEYTIQAVYGMGPAYTDGGNVLAMAKLQVDMGQVDAGKGEDLKIIHETIRHMGDEEHTVLKGPLTQITNLYKRLRGKVFPK
ncbi:hypothetical protein ACFLRF_02615 [Candidatus Altiarchaeota archaeon]